MIRVVVQGEVVMRLGRSGQFLVMQAYVAMRATATAILFCFPATAEDVTLGRASTEYSSFGLWDVAGGSKMLAQMPSSVGVCIESPSRKAFLAEYYFPASAAEEAKTRANVAFEVCLTYQEIPPATMNALDGAGLTVMKYLPKRGVLSLVGGDEFFDEASQAQSARETELSVDAQASTPVGSYILALNPLGTRALFMVASTNSNAPLFGLRFRFAVQTAGGERDFVVGSAVMVPSCSQQPEGFYDIAAARFGCSHSGGPVP